MDSLTLPLHRITSLQVRGKIPIHESQLRQSGADSGSALRRYGGNSWELLTGRAVWPSTLCAYVSSFLGLGGLVSFIYYLICINTASYAPGPQLDTGHSIVTGGRSNRVYADGIYNFLLRSLASSWYIDLLEMGLPGYSGAATDNQGSFRPTSKSVNLPFVLQRARLKVTWAIRVWPEGMGWPLTLGLASAIRCSSLQAILSKAGYVHTSNLLHLSI